MFSRHGSSLYPRPWAGETYGKRVYISQQTLFGDVKVSEVTPLIELSPVALPLSELRDVITTTGSGSVTESGGEYNLSTGSTGGSTARLASGEVIRYAPRYPINVGQGIRRPSAPDGNVVWEVGIADDADDNAFYFGEDSGGVYVRHISGGSQIAKVYQAGWNRDRMDGAKGIHNPSGLTLDLRYVAVPQIDGSWYGGGPYVISVVVTDRNDDNRSVTVPLHSFAAPLNGPVVANPNLFITERVDNGGDATDFTLFVLGRQASTQGKFSPNRRFTDETVFEASLGGTTIVPVLSMRRKAGFEAVSVKLAGASFIPSADVEWLFIYNGTLTGASWGGLTNVPADETAMEVDTAATAISGGQAIDAGVRSSGAGQNTASSSVETLDFDFVRSRPVTLAMRKVTGTGGSVTANFAVREEA